MLVYATYINTPSSLPTYYLPRYIPPNRKTLFRASMASGHLNIDEVPASPRHSCQCFANNPVPNPPYLPLRNPPCRRPWLRLPHPKTPYAYNFFLGLFFRPFKLISCSSITSRPPIRGHRHSSIPIRTLSRPAPSASSSSPNTSHERQVEGEEERKNQD